MPAPPRKRTNSPAPSDGRSSKRARLDVLPGNPLRFHREPSGTIQISTWNVAGLVSCNAEKWQVRSPFPPRGEPALSLVVAPD